jgi:hypothetical protein
MLWGLGRVGSCGGGSSWSVPGLVGGLLKGEFSSDTSTFLTTFDVRTVSGSLTRDLSLRGAGGGGADFPSRFSSPDRLGAGGDGGLAPARGDLGGGGAGAGLVDRIGEAVPGFDGVVGVE